MQDDGKHTKSTINEEIKKASDEGLQGMLRDSMLELQKLNTKLMLGGKKGSYHLKFQGNVKRTKQKIARIKTEIRARNL